MKKSKTTYLQMIRLLLCSGLIQLMLGSCEKKEEIQDAEPFVISTTPDKNNAVDSQLDVSISGGVDTLYVFSNHEFKSAFQTLETQDWLSIIKIDYLSDIGATRMILDIEPLEESFAIRSGILSLINQSQLAGKFIRISQGYVNRYTESFTWLKYGSANPLDEGRESPIQSWNNTQLAYGWTSTIDETTQLAHTYGRFEHIKLGSETNGADLLSPIIGGIEKDSLLLLTFNAVAYASIEGVKDANKLTVELQNGCQFEDGSSAITLDLTHYDHQSPLIANKMWDESIYVLPIKKPALNTVISTLRLRFLTGNDLSAAKNRVYLDNIQLYTVAEFIKQGR